ncbi:MAG: endoglucanase A [Deltaproteobacteria bacterium]|nr:endoglucanase A [Deltaproteobacteria bacterium]
MENSKLLFLAFALVILTCSCEGANSKADPSSDDYEGNAPGECSDDVDNDRDGLFDCNDPNCSGSAGCGENSSDTTPGDSTETSATDSGSGTTAGSDNATDNPDTIAVPGEVQFAINSSQEVHPISPFIYGTNGVDVDGLADNCTIDRFGGNRATAYNWENNASNAGSDWYYSNDSLLGGGDTSGEAVRLHVQHVFELGGAAIVTVPLVDYVAADKDGNVDLSDSNYLASRFVASKASKGAAFAYPPNLNDKVVYQDEFVSWLSSEFPDADTHPMNRLFYSLDNEPDLWSSTHPEVHPDPVTYAELLSKTIEYATAIKTVNPNASILGFVSYGFNGFLNLQGASDSDGNGDFINYFLDGLQAAELSSGQRLMDVLDVHWYPEAKGGGTRILTEDSTAEIVEARVQSPRSLWDSTYTETSWIANYLGEPIQILPRLKQQIADHYPGTKLGITEYYYGGGNHISGGVAEADVLGIFGREEVYIATVWTFDATYVYGAIDMFQNYDGAKAKFGDTHILATTSSIEDTSIYASLDSTDSSRMVLVAINKSNRPINASISITHDTQFTTGSIYQLTSGSASPAPAGTASITNNMFTHTLPALSVSTIELTTQ